MFYSKYPARSFRGRGVWSETTPELHASGDALKLVEFGSWNEAYAWRPREKVGSASFFADGEALFAETEPILGKGSVRVQRLLVNLRSREKKEQVAPLVSDGLFFMYVALEGRILLGAGINATTSKIETLVRVDAQSDLELLRVPAAEAGESRTFKRQCDVTVTADRRNFVYSIDNALLFRNSGDLGIAWTRQAQPGLLFSRVSISANGALVAASVGDTSPTGGDTKFIEIYDGRNGTTLARLSAFSRETIAISPDGKLLAMGQMVPIEGKQFGRVISGTQPTVALFDIASGRKVATLIHDRFIGGGREFIYSSFGLQSGISFTPDSKYLITSGRSTKIWEIARS